MRVRDKARGKVKEREGEESMVSLKILSLLDFKKFSVSNFFTSGWLLFKRSILNCIWYLFHVLMHWYLMDFSPEMSVLTFGTKAQFLNIWFNKSFKIIVSFVNVCVIKGKKIYYLISFILQFYHLLEQVFVCFQIWLA